MNIILLEVKDILDVHEEVINTYGGLHGIRDLNLIESLVGHAQMISQYQECYLDDLAGIYFYHIIKNHAFIDGNKRTGVVSTLIFFKKNGVNLTVNLDSFYLLSLKTAESSIDKEEVRKFFGELLNK